MKVTQRAEELLKRYRFAVARCLPMKKRHDISLEIESMLLDVCEERYGRDTEINERQMESVLIESGKPSQVARRYKTEKPLIGTELMPIFKLILMIVCIVTSVVSVIELFFNISEMTTAETGLYLIELFQSLTGAVGTIFIIFVILERILKNKPDFNPVDETWNIKDLPELKEKIPSRAEIVAGLVFSSIAILALIFFTQRIGIYRFSENGTSFIPILAPEILRLVPLFCARIALGAVILLPFIGSKSVKQSKSRDYYYNISRMGLEVFDIGILLLLLSRGAESFFIMENFGAAGLGEIEPIAGNIFTGILLLLTALSVFNIIKRTLVILPKGNV